MTLATFLLLAMMAGLFAYDALTTRGARGGLWLEAASFLVGGVFVVFPEWSTKLAHLVGIGRGVDFVLYVVVVWLVRESLKARRERLLMDQRLTEAVRALALARQTTAGE